MGVNKNYLNTMKNKMEYQSYELSISQTTGLGIANHCFNYISHYGDMGKICGVFSRIQFAHWDI